MDRSAESPTRPIDHLEPAQLDTHTRRPLAPAVLSRRTRAGLWTLRVFVLTVTAMIIYTFVTHL